MKKLLALIFSISIGAFGSTGDLVGAYVGTNGWDLYLTFEGLSTNGTYSLGWATNNWPSTPKVTIGFASQAWTTLGASTTRSRTVYGTKRIRKAYPNNAAADETLTPTNVTVRVALSDYVYSGDSNLVLTLLSGAYTQGAPNNPASSYTVTNLSQQNYPKVIANWTKDGWRFEPEGTNIVLRAMAFQKFGQVGRPVVGAMATVKDSGGNTITNYQTLTFVDGYYPDAAPFSEFIFKFPTNQLASGLLTCNAKFWPWIGDASTIADSSTETDPQPTSLFATQTNAVNMRITRAFVSNSGNNASGIAANDVYWATNTAPPAFLTQAGARAAIYGTNNASYGRANEGAAYLYLMAGTHTNLGGTLTQANGPDVELVVTRDPAASVDQVSIVGFATDARGKDNEDTVRVRGVTVNGTDSNMWTGHRQVSFESNVILNLGASSIQALAGGATCMNYLWNTVSNHAQGFKAVSTTQDAFVGLLRGNTIVGDVSDTTYETMVGNVWTTAATTQGRIRNSNVSPKASPIWGGILYNNVFNRRQYLGTILSVGEYFSITNGAVIANNIFEATTNNTASCAFQIATTDNLAFTNVLVINNTLVGTKSFFFYNDSGSNAFWRVDCVVINNAIDDYNLKTDDFGGSENGGRVGNWGEVYGVGYYGNAMLETTSIGAPGSFLGEWEGLYSWSTTTDSTSSTNYPMWVFRKANDATGTSQAGGGDYRLYSASPMFQRNKTRWILRHDVRGLVRGYSDPPGAERSAVKMEVDQVRFNQLFNGSISP